MKGKAVLKLRFMEEDEILVRHRINVG